MYKRIFMSGAAGILGRYLRPQLAARWSLRLCDLSPIHDPEPNTDVVTCDLADRQAIFDAMQGCDAVIHLGAISDESDFDPLLATNIAGTFNVFEGARRAGVRRVIYASSNHAIGFYERGVKLDADSAPRPDTLYGVTKAFGEALGRMYWHKYGIEHALLRIGSARPVPEDARQLSTWLSHPDLLQLVERSLEVPRLGCTVIYGQSNNDRAWWDNSKASYVGYRPTDNAEHYAKEILANAPLMKADDPRLKYMGGVYATENAPRYQGIQSPSQMKLKLVEPGE